MYGTFVGKPRAALLGGLALALSLFNPSRAVAKPNTHAPAISTWDARASSIVVGLGSAMSGDGAFSFTSYNANFSSTNGVLSAQFGVHYVTYKEDDAAPLARGVSAGGVALISLPLASRYENGVPKSSFAFYIGGVPTAMFSGQLNFISVPLVLGVGLPLSPSPWVTFRPWVELSPGLNFDTRISAVATESAIQAAMDGMLTREEVEDLVEEGLHIERETTVGKRAGLSASIHLGERVDIDGNLMLGAGHAGAVSLGAALVFRWDAMVHELNRSSRRGDDAESCNEIAARYYRQCPLRRDPGRAAPRSRSGADPRRRREPVPSAAGVRSREPYRAPPPLSSPQAAPGAAPAAAPPPSPAPSVAPLPAAPSGTTSGSSPAKKPASSAPPAPGVTPPAAVAPKPGELPPLQAAPPRTP
ncbi:MAG TPA: hypothetical protein VMG12_42835 [Polyangiaceae bacterium]|nr:hypothetical protein [Polyangiaceae bacterium]